jgi:hypothetical protein
VFQGHPKSVDGLDAVKVDNEVDPTFARRWNSGPVRQRVTPSTGYVSLCIYTP